MIFSIMDITKITIKRVLKILVLVLLLILMARSCSTPEKYAKRDAKEMNRAMDRENGNAMERAERHFEKHLYRYRNNSDKYFRYADTYKEYID